MNVFKLTDSYHIAKHPQTVMLTRNVTGYQICRCTLKYGLMPLHDVHCPSSFQLLINQEVVKCYQFVRWPYVLLMTRNLEGGSGLWHPEGKWLPSVHIKYLTIDEWTRLRTCLQWGRTSLVTKKPWNPEKNSSHVDITRLGQYAGVRWSPQKQQVGR